MAGGDKAAGDKAAGGQTAEGTAAGGTVAGGMAAGITTAAGSGWRERVALALALLLGLGLPMALGSMGQMFNDGDVSWHVATGRWIIEHRAIPVRDPFSWTMAGRPWLAIEWGAELLLGGAWMSAGDSGVVALVSLALVALHLVMIGWIGRSAGPVRLVATIALLDAVLMPFMLARPHLLAWPLLAMMIVVLMKARAESRAPAPGWAVLMLLWANIHGSYALGLVIAAAFGLEAVIADRGRRATVYRWGRFGLLLLIAACSTPAGPAGLLHPLFISSMKILPLIIEWQPSRFDFTPAFFVAMVIVVVIIGVRRAWRTMSVVRMLLLAALVAMALLQMRHQAVWAIAAALILAEPLAGKNERSLWSALPKDEGRKLAWVGGVVAAVLLAMRMAWPFELADNGFHPRRAIAAVPVALRSQPLFNNYSFGGPLILAGIRPYIDGRADMYGDDFAIRFRAMIYGDKAQFDRVAAARGIRWLMLSPNDGLTPKIAADRRWRRIYGDPSAVIFVRVYPPGTSAS